MFTTDQDEIWHGEFGDEYTDRNRKLNWRANNTAFFSKVFGRTSGIQSVLELGPNIGLNLMAIQSLLPDAVLSGVEINVKAALELFYNIPSIEVFNRSFLDFEPQDRWDFVFTKAVLIHVAPDNLPKVYDMMYRASARYIMVAEYYSPVPVECEYRGKSGILFKRDFAGEMMDRFLGLRLIDYGFWYHRDVNFPQDDLTWFLMEV